jgi:hypothetical protein
MRHIDDAPPSDERWDDVSHIEVDEARAAGQIEHLPAAERNPS